MAPYQFQGISVIGKIIFLLNIITYLCIWASLILRFCRFRRAFINTLNDPEESYMIPAAALGFAVIILGIEAYGVPACGEWLLRTQLVLFWIFIALAICIAVGLNWHMYRTRMATRQPFALVRLLPSFPAMLGGTTAALLTPAQPPHLAIPMLIGGTALQGFGFMMSIFILAEFLYGLHHHGLPPMRRRPHLFIAAGPPAFTALALMGMADVATEKLPAHFIPLAAHVNTADVLLVIAVFISIFFWVLSFFFYMIAWLSILDARREWRFDIGWWGTVFPNSGFTLATVKLADLLDSRALKWVGSAATIIQVILWLGCASSTVWAVLTRRALWPGMDEGFGPDQKCEEGEGSDLKGGVHSGSILLKLPSLIGF
ncbi:hypothetical protein BO70DRAFT_352765 [Aspergillus heteromorphus CBS 117.55]|uniref:C4-dicarboxylate transporter/malic acid transport protein n=1 Tax=Aspergillus heteromorphus CBS 117.55 TaxID=1448321 RepID=A0A317W7V2_9EURO|nr:uncharacterized protein BO70DRAFT_352765 [Aspergillus heteromorphus CBS 117.55]PWY82159.1 hypothetical protein BO70DRAFT_352765 [Aspergillus heteromorphus CBS 117.55]